MINNVIDFTFLFIFIALLVGLWRCDWKTTNELKKELKKLLIKNALFCAALFLILAFLAYRGGCGGGGH
jgi:hypothetical protein